MTQHRHLRLVDPVRPVTRGDCESGPRPCVQTWCRHNLATACVLDIAEAGTLKLHEVAALLGMSRERVRQIEEIALGKLEKRLDRDMLSAWTHATEPAGDSQWTDVIDAEFKAGVQAAYERIVPLDEQGSKAIRVSTKRGGHV